MAMVFTRDLIEMARSIRAEVEYADTASTRSPGRSVHRVQEWAQPERHIVVVDGIFRLATIRMAEAPVGVRPHPPRYAPSARQAGRQVYQRRRPAYSQHAASFSYAVAGDGPFLAAVLDDTFLTLEAYEQRWPTGPRSGRAPCLH